MREIIASGAESLRDEMSTFLQEIVAIPSLSGQEGPVIDRLRRGMEEIGYDEVEIDPMGNLIGRLGSGERVIAIDGHCDTVDVGNRDTWEVDPFGGECREGVIFGRGAADQKGGLVSALYAGKILKETGVPGNIALHVVASVFEEDVEGLNWKYIIEEDGITPDVVLLTEPTGLKINIGQRGRMEIRVKTRGISCHGSAPDRGENAIYKIAPVIEEVEQLHSSLEGDSVLGNGSVTITDIRSTAPSLCAVADSATIHLDRRLTEGETEEIALQQVRELPSVQAAAAEVFIPEYQIKSHTGLIYPVNAFYPPWLMDRDDPVIQTASRAYRELFDHEAGLGVWQFSTNGVTTKGIHGIPTFGFGPGREEHAHTPNDQVRVDDLVKAAGFYAAFVLAFSEN